MSEANPCHRCGYPVDHDLGRDDYTCMACRTWESAVMRRKPALSNAMYEGLSLRGDTMAVDFWYPRSDEEPTFLQIGLYDVRAANDIKVHYDFDRDGWVIEQAWIEVVEVQPSPEHPRGYDDHVDRWEEVGFFRAWGLNREKGQDGTGSKEREHA